MKVCCIVDRSGELFIRYNKYIAPFFAQNVGCLLLLLSFCTPGMVYRGTYMKNVCMVWIHHNDE